MRANKPEITRLDPITVLTVTSVGDPNYSEKYLSALYGTAYLTKFKVYKPVGKIMSLGKLIGRWPDAHLKPKDQWTGIWGLPVPSFVSEDDLIQKDHEVPVSVETWKYGEVAQVLHKGPYTQEGPTITLLHDFIKQSGYKIDGTHEEVYLTSPDAKEQKTVIRYPIVRVKQK